MVTIPSTTNKKRVVSGMRPTGKLHIGHYFGALENWVRLQNDPAYECFYFIADWHALTSDYADTSSVAQNTIEIVTDSLAAGLDPQKSVIFQQSLIPEHAELHLLLGMVTPLSWLERVPTYKEQLENVTNKDLHNYGFLGYPCLQTADIVIYSKEGTPLFVPVGEDQVSHVELSREIVRKFNMHNIVLSRELLRPENGMSAVVLEDSFRGAPKGGGHVPTLSENDLERLQRLVRQRVAEVGLENFLEHLKRSGDEASKSGFYRDQVKYFEDFKASHNIFRKFLTEMLCEPEAMLTRTPRIPGLDGRKMSKSYGNAITLSESDDDIRKKTKVMVTDPARKRRTDPGNPDVCPVYDWHKLFSSPQTLEWAANGCRTAGIGCIECKAKMADHLIEWIAPVRERRIEYEKHPKRVLEVIDEGSKKARVEAVKTMERVREAVFGWQKKRNEVSGSL
ncbi:MAG: tryptophan--tRNA ligase [Candidatus Acidiferrum sp.]